jgi:hypothetical protein
MENQVKIDLSKTRHFEAGAIILAMLALPDASDEDRGGLIYSLCHRALRAKFDLTKSDSHIEQPLKPIYVFRTEADLAKDFKKFDRLLRDRFIAADIALALLKRKTDALPETLPPGLAKFSLNELCERAAKKYLKSRKRGGVIEAGNVESRQWRSSQPVLHFAIALAIFTQAYHREGRGQIKPVEILGQPELIEWLIMTANAYGDILEQHGILGAKAPALIRIRLIQA